MRLNIPAGTAVRFEPGDSKSVELVELGGQRRVEGLNGLTNGSVAEPGDRARVVGLARERGFTDEPGGGRQLMAEISRQHYAELYGPTAGDRFRLADTELSARWSATS